MSPFKLAIALVTLSSLQFALPSLAQELALPSRDSLSALESEKIQKKLGRAAFSLVVQQRKPHALAEKAPKSYGIAVAIEKTALEKLLLNLENEAKVPEPKPQQTGSIFFGKGLEKSSSPFAAQEARQNKLKLSPEAAFQSERQYYLSTADWLNFSEKLTLLLENTALDAQLVYRDDARNLAILSTETKPNVEALSLLPQDEALPAFGYALVETNYPQKNVQLQPVQLAMTDRKRYAHCSLTLSPGTPIVDHKARLLALFVQPNRGQKPLCLHHLLIQEALQRPVIQVESIELVLQPLNPKP